MESYEKIRKMGEISEQLKKHGLAEDSQEALKQAEGLMMDKKQEGQVYVSSDDAAKATETSSNEQSIETERALRQLGSQFNDKISSLDSQVHAIRDKINEIIAKMNELESKIPEGEAQEVQATLAPKEEAAPEPVPEKKDDNAVQPEVKKEYNSADVAVDKVFYSGNK